jgi:rubrerythrin
MILNEDLFDEISTVDPEFVPVEDAIEGPSTPEEVGTSHLILDAISKVTEMISMYNDLLANTDNEEIIQIVNEIVEDNNRHMGMLQSALEVVSPNAEAIEDGAEEADDILDESLNEDIHDKFKKDIKNDYKAWASKQEKQEAKRKEFLSMLDEIENVTPEQREKMEKAANDLFPDEEFNYKFPHNIEKEDFPFYVTYYAEYPIYEPAEGGYYYAGQDAIWSEGFNTKEDALDYAKKYTSEDSDTWEELTDGFVCKGKYIGEDQYVRIEDNKSYLGDVKGWEPYQ